MGKGMGTKAMEDDYLRTLRDIDNNSSGKKSVSIFRRACAHALAQFTHRRGVNFCVLLICVGCMKSEVPKDQRLKISMMSHPTTLDPGKSGDFASSTLICLTFEGLTRCIGGEEIELALAERVEISEDQKRYLFYLRPSVWSDGKQVTAYDFERSWKRILDPHFPAICPYLLYPIQNAERYAQGEACEIGIRALNERMLEVLLERPTPYFLSLTAFPLFFPVASHNPEVTNGPFLIEKREMQQEIQLTKNYLFWNRDQIHLEGIDILILPDETSALHLFEQGELDLVGGPLSPLPLDALAHFEDLRFIPMAASTFCTFNTTCFPFHNEALRKAFVYAIDQETLARELTFLGQDTARNLLPPSLSQVEMCREKEKAFSLFQKGLAELGIEAKDLSSLTLYFKPSPIDKRLAQTLQAEWKKGLGIEVRLAQTEAKTYLKRLQNKEYQLSLASWIAQFFDPINLLERFKWASHMKNYPGWEDAEFQEWLNLAQHADRNQFLAKAEQKLGEAAVIAPLYHWRSPLLVQKRVRHLASTSCGGLLFERCSVSEPESSFAHR